MVPSRSNISFPLRRNEAWKHQRQPMGAEAKSTKPKFPLMFPVCILCDRWWHVSLDNQVAKSPWQYIQLSQAPRTSGTMAGSMNQSSRACSRKYVLWVQWGWMSEVMSVLGSGREPREPREISQNHTRDIYLLFANWSIRGRLWNPDLFQVEWISWGSGSTTRVPSVPEDPT